MYIGIPYLEYYYKYVVAPEMCARLQLKSSLDAPRFDKCVVDFTSSRVIHNPEILFLHLLALEWLTSRRGQAIKAKSSIASPNLRVNAEVGSKITLRSSQMYVLMEYLAHHVFPNMPSEKRPGADKPQVYDRPSGFSVAVPDLFLFTQLANQYDNFAQVTGSSRGVKINFKLRSNCTAHSKMLCSLFNFPL
uniref:50S ribosomal protein L5, chloroplastic n=1 Tax=Cavernulicola chilensis TaxID=3028028 RepID=A0A7H0WB82_9RHOD|nr:50S ribosomal protein L5 [Cavernulicola chilensis]QNR39811.1 50S ribosomal protein L5 [Cavernulicola chilensis]